MFRRDKCLLPVHLQPDICQGQDLYPAPKEEKVERIRERFTDIRKAYARAEELKVDGWKPRVSGWHGDATLTATRKAA
jgi:hypothetical protein